MDVCGVMRPLRQLGTEYSALGWRLATGMGESFEPHRKSRRCRARRRPAGGALNLDNDPHDNLALAAFPTLARWLRAAPPDHPWRQWVERRWPKWEAIGQSLETILAEIEGAAPTRMARKRTAFARDVAGYLTLRAELNVGYELARAGISFAFGAAGQPDYECGGAHHPWHIEVGTRARDDFSQLYDDVQQALSGSNVVATLHVPRQVVINAHDRRATCERVVDAVGALTENSPMLSMGLPEVNGGITLTTPSLTGLLHVFIDTAPPAPDHGAEVEREIQNVLREKTEQARRGGWSNTTLLVLDVTRLGLSWLPVEAVWDGRLHRMKVPWEEIPFAALAIVTSDLEQAGIRGSALMSPRLAGARADSIALLLEALGLRHAHPAPVSTLSVP